LAAYGDLDALDADGYLSITRRKKDGELSPTGKIRHRIVAHRYAGILDDLYNRDP